MPLSKRNFQKAKMNKDADERLIPQGHYRDALNIQVSTSDGSNAGSAQTLLGNTKHSTMLDPSGVYEVNGGGLDDDTATCVATVAAKDVDKIYYFVSGGDEVESANYRPIRKDYILEYDTVSQKHRYVFTDIYKVTTTTTAQTSDQPFVSLNATSTVNDTGIRLGMIVTGVIDGVTYTIADGLAVSLIKYNAGTTDWHIYLTHPDGTAFDDASAAGVTLNFHAKRVLKFSKENIITGINVLDDFIYWTDNYSEPKKINISRSIAGTGGTEYLNGAGNAGWSNASVTNTAVIFTGDKPYFHTRLVKDKSSYSNAANRYEVVTNAAGNKAVYVDESHVTVIKKAPTQPLELDMFRGPSSRITDAGVENSLNSQCSLDVGSVEVGGNINVTFANNVDFRSGDVLLLVRQTSNESPATFENYDIRAQVTESNVTGPNALSSSGFVLQVRSISTDLQDEDLTSSIPFFVRLETDESLFNLKFPRFSYRYKYQDGEYSTFAPWSKIAFLPDHYEFKPKKGYNLGMVNQVKSIKLKGYHASEAAMPEDVVEIDLLYKETNNPTVYTVKTLRRADGFDAGIWPNFNADANARGEFILDTDLIYAVVPSNQLLRPWDNVPRKALAQEISANRVVYGNYLQNYTILKDPVINVSLHVDGLHYAGIGWGGGYALPSVKTLRDYQVGVVFSDEYGRETPVLTSKKASISVPKELSKRRNRLVAQLDQETSVPDWAKYYSYYIKETSTDYHSLAMDRWYAAEDGNIWLSFPSSERNKIDIDTFLILKKAHGTNVVVEDKAKYKVLAIESEAPDDIKSVDKPLGELFGGLPAGGVISNGQDGYPLQDKTFIYVDSSTFLSTFGQDLVTQSQSLEIYLILTGSGSVSKQYQIGSIVEASSGNFYKVNIVGRFREDASFVSSDDTLSGAIDDLSMRIIEKEVINSPDFDGRFFAKINWDEGISQHIAQPNASDFTVTESWPLRYVNNNAWAGGGAGNGTDTEQALHYFDSNVYSEHPTAGDINWVDSSRRYWGGNSAEDGSSEAFGLSADKMRHQPDRINSEDFGPSYWEGLAKEKVFFIDACTAYSWNGRRPGNDNSEGSRPGGAYSDQVFNFTDGVGQNYGALWDGGGDDGGFETGNGLAQGSSGGYENLYAYAGNLSNASNTSQCMPSRGIWSGGQYMDISWVGMEATAYDGSNWNDKPFHTKLSSTNVPDAFDFITKLTTTGTKFRFQKDPAETVYTVSLYEWDSGYGNTDLYNEEMENGMAHGAYGIRNFATVNDRDQYLSHNLRQRWTIKVDPPIGEGGSYNPIVGSADVEPLSQDGYTHLGDVIEILGPVEGGFEDTFSENPAIWETEPKESVDLDIYYQATGLIPVELNEKTNEEYLPIGTKFKRHEGTPADPTIHTITNWTGPQTFTFTPAITSLEVDFNPITANSTVVFDKRDSYSLTAVAKSVVNEGESSMTLWGGPETTLASRKLYSQKHRLDWSNCYSFENGLESDTVRDSFNGAKLDNGVKASTVLAVQSREERRKNGMIWSGIYNSSSGVNDTNQFIAAEKITKDVNPSHGSIQRLFNRDTSLAIFCEDKVLQAQTDKDALYNADGKPQLVASNTVIGDVTTYQGDWGISKNPESLAVTPGNLYFTDIIRGQVLALSNEGVRSISNAGMKDYFADLSKSYVWRSLGTYDERKNEYNVTISKKYASYQIQPHEQTTLSYSEIAKGWTSFKSFNPQNGVSLNNDYFTFFGGHVWKHHANEIRNNFYGKQYTSNVTLVFNDAVEAAKSIGSINYEGTQARITNFDDEAVQLLTGDIDDSINGSPAYGLAASSTVNDGEYFNIESTVPGWYAESIVTNLQTCGELEFKDKEGKWFGIPSGEDTSLSNIDGKEFSVQGLGTATVVRAEGENQRATFDLTVSNNTSTTYVGIDETGGAWDSTAD
jgi:hypothetical protein